MIKSNNSFKCTATLLGALAILSIAPATAFADESSGCNYKGAAIDNGDDVFVDGMIASCRRGSIVVTTPPERAGTGLSTPLGGGGSPALTEVTPAPQPTKHPKLPVINLPVLTTGL